MCRRPYFSSFLEPVQCCECRSGEHRENHNHQYHRQHRRARCRRVCVDFRMRRRGVDVVSRLTMLTQVTGVTFDRLALVISDALRVSLYEAAIEYASGQAFIVVRFNSLEIMERDLRLIADFAQANASLIACDSQLFAYARCHLQSLVSWRWLGLDCEPGSIVAPL